MNKVHKGTPQHSGPSLCVSCRSAAIVQGLADSSERVYCRAITGNYGEDVIMTQPVIKCSQYSNKTTPMLHEFEEIAWTLRTDKSGQKIGFISPQQAKALRKRGELD